MDEGVAGGGGQVAGEHDVLLGIADGRRSGARGGGIPANFVEAGVKRGRFDLVGALALNRNQDASGDIGLCPDRGAGDRCAQSDSDVTLRVGRAAVGNGHQRRSVPEVGAVHHQIVAHLRIQPCGAAENQGAAAHRGVVAHLAERADDHAVSKAAVTHGGRGARIRVGRPKGGGTRNGHRDLVVQVLLEKAGRGDGIIRDAVLPNDFRGHHHDRRDRREQKAGHGERREDLDQGESRLASGRNGPRSLVEKTHGTVRATVMLCVCRFWPWGWY